MSKHPSCCSTSCSTKEKAPNVEKIVFMRHGESEWNQKNLFCGWFNAPLTERGRLEAARAGQALKMAGFEFDIAFTSVLSRAIESLAIVLKEMHQTNVPVIKTWRLNERHYGALTGYNKTEMVAKHGEAQIGAWRRSYDVPPPPISQTHAFYRTIVSDPCFKNGPPIDRMPKAESLKMTIERTLPFWKADIMKKFLDDKKILIVAHGNSLRGIVKYLDNLTAEEIVEVNLPTGIPFTYRLDRALRVVKGEGMQFIGDKETVERAIEEVINQGKGKLQTNEPKN